MTRLEYDTLVGVVSLLRIADEEAGERSQQLRKSAQERLMILLENAELERDDG